MSNQGHAKVVRFFTSGQVAKLLKVSVSTLKRWDREDPYFLKKRRNINGWRLYSEQDVEHLRESQRFRKKSGKQFRDITLKPVEK